MISFDHYPNENKTEQNLKRPYIPDHLYKILILRGTGPKKQMHYYPANNCWSWRHVGRQKLVTLKTSWKHLEDMSWRRLEDMSWWRV